MNSRIKKVLDNFEINEEQYNRIYDYLKCLNFDYNDGKDLSHYSFEGYVCQIIGDKYSHYPAERIAIEIYKTGEFQELIKNVIYKENIKVLSELNKSF